MNTYLVAGMAFGDESKGATVDALCRSLPIDLIVRYNGGCQAAHHVQLEDGRSHCFSQFGAGMLANDKVQTYLSRYMLVEPFSMVNESRALNVLTPQVWARTTVDAKAVVVTPFHKYLNQLRERSRGKNAHGSCGRGIGVARELQIKFNDDDRVLRAGDLRNSARTLERLNLQFEALYPEIKELEVTLGEEPISLRQHRFGISDWVERYAMWPAKIVTEMPKFEHAVFEGAQGVMLDEVHGTAPHNTWTNTTFENADTLLNEAGVGKDERYYIGCFRTYYTRHGAGPFPTEDNTLNLPELHNGNDGFQGNFRVGQFDFTLAKQAYQIVGGLDGIALSHVDYLSRLGWNETDFVATMMANLATPICMIASGPTAADRVVSKSEVPVCQTSCS